MHWSTLQMAALATAGPEWSQKPEHLDHLPVLPRCVSRERNQKWSGQNTNGPFGMLGTAGGSLTPRGTTQHIYFGINK